jgi:nucleotide-binding universal stress UspA family protein
MIAPAKQRLLNILLADDGSLNARAAVKFLVDLPHDKECVVTALRVFTPLDAAEYANVEDAIEQTKNLLKSRHLHYHTETRLGYPTEKIIEYANQHHPDLIVMGAKGTGANLGLLLGSVAMNIVQDGRWPVLIVREPERGLRKVLLVTDGSACSQLACDYAGVFPLPESADVEVMHVLPLLQASYFVDSTGMSFPAMTEEDLIRMRQDQETDGEALIHKTVEALAGHGLEARGLLMRGDTPEQIINYAREHGVDLIICGSRGYGTLTSMLLGSVSRRLAHHAPCSVLVVRCQQHG